MKFYWLLISVIYASSCFAQGTFKSEMEAHRIQYKKDFKEHDYSPFYHFPAAMKDLHFFSPKKKYKVTATIELIKTQEPVQIKTYSGKEKKFRKYAWAHFNIKGKKHKLILYQNVKNLAIPQYRDLLFLPFKDITNDQSTYGGGRYIDINKNEIAEGKLILDFNKCYNPYCAYSDGYNCPVPPIENHLGIKIPAGEKMYSGEKLHRQQ